MWPLVYNRPRVGDNQDVPKLRGKAGRSGRTFGTVVLLWNLWQRIPKKHRRKLLQLARKHGPRLARQAIDARRKTKRFR